MKTVIFIFVPVVIERTKIQVPAEAEHPNQQIVTKREEIRDEVYPFWTWFIDNPRPQGISRPRMNVLQLNRLLDRLH